MINYADDVARLGDGGLGGDKFLTPKGLFLTLPDFSIATRAACATETSYSNAILLDQIFNVGQIFDYEDVSVETKYGESQSGMKLKTMPMLKAQKFMINMNVDQKREAIKLNNKDFRVILYDQSNQFKLVEDGTTFKGALARILVEFADGKTDKPGLCTIFVQYYDHNEMDTKYIVQPVTWSIQDLPSLTNVVITPGAVAANVFSIDVKYVSQGENDKLGVAMTGTISGAVTANFKVLTSAGVARTVTATESTTVSGRYSVTGTGVVATDTVQFVPTVGSPYISTVSTLE